MYTPAKIAGLKDILKTPPGEYHSPVQCRHSRRGDSGTSGSLGSVNVDMRVEGRGHAGLRSTSRAARPPRKPHPWGDGSAFFLFLDFYLLNNSGVRPRPRGGLACVVG